MYEYLWVLKPIEFRFQDLDIKLSVMIVLTYDVVTFQKSKLFLSYSTLEFNFIRFLL